MPPVRQTRERVAAVRRFNRFYTRQIGVLRKNYLDSPYSLGEMRVLYELSHGEVKHRHRHRPRARSRRGLFEPRAAQFRETRPHQPQDVQQRRAQSELALTARGAQIFAPLEQRSQNLVGGMLGRLQARRAGAAGGGDDDHRNAARRAAPETARPSRLISCVRRGTAISAGSFPVTPSFTRRNTAGWEPFEGLCAQIVADFVNKYDAKRERCWIAELNGENVGCIMLARDSNRSEARSAYCWSIPRGAGSVSARA